MAKVLQVRTAQSMGAMVAMLALIAGCSPENRAADKAGNAMAETISKPRDATSAPAAAGVVAAGNPWTGEASAVDLPIVPVPLRVERGEGFFALSVSTRVTPAFSGGEQATSAKYFTDLIFRTRGIQLGSAARGDIQFMIDSRAATQNPESYELRVTPQSIVVSARQSRGLFYGAVTLWQLATADSPRAGAIKVPAVHIVDEPRFGWRGVLLDSARHYQSPEFIERFIDAMALHKLNVLHWHLTDDQAWRLEIKKYPKLTDIGAWRVPAGAAPAKDIDSRTGKPRLYGGFYSQATARKLVAYAASRNITIVPEIEMPGHASAAIAAYPQLAAVNDAPKAVPADWGVYQNLYNVEEPTFSFLENVLTEVMDVFPSAYIHVGGDEPVKNQWKASARVQARMREWGIEDEQRLQSHFIQRMEKFLDAHGRRLIGWDEILEGGLGPQSTVMSWRGIDGALAAAQAGHDAVLSPAPTLYFDNRQSTSASEPPGRGRVVTAEEIYRFDPLPPALRVEQHRHILGVQGNLWTEHVRTEDRALYMTFPRAAAVAEIGWSSPENREWSSFVKRMRTQFTRYDALGIKHAAITPPPVAPPSPTRRSSYDLKLCTENLVLSLEDDAPLSGTRATFLVDVMNPCWIFEAADLSQVSSIQASVGQLPFNFQLGDDVKKIPLPKPQTREGELEVRLDSCQGERIATLPLAPALARDDVTTLPQVTIARKEGRHDLCLTFTRGNVDPIWAIDSVQLLQ
jgi:hexosaminidase